MNVGCRIAGAALFACAISAETLASTSDDLANGIINLLELDAALSPIHRVSWKAGGGIQGPMQVTPAGEVVALVALTPSRVEFVRWNSEGKEVLRRAVQVPVPVVATRLTSEGGLVIVAEGALVKLGPDGMMLARRELPFSLRVPNELSHLVWAEAAATSDGAWIALPERLVLAGLDGKDVIVLAPIGVSCAMVPQVPDKECQERIHALGLVATEKGECLLAEDLTIWHKIKGGRYDHTEQLFLSLLSRSGEVRATRKFGETSTQKEWFWVERGSQNPTPFPEDFGLVRTRYNGKTVLREMAERREGGFVLALGEAGRGEIVRRLEADLKDRWRAPYIARWGTISASWTRGVLIFNEAMSISLFDEAGAKGEGHVEQQPDSKPRRDRTAIGQTPRGNWIVAWHDGWNPVNTDP